MNWMIILEEAVRGLRLGDAKAAREEKEELLKRHAKQIKKYHKDAEKKEPLVDENEIAEVVSSWTKIPVKKLTADESAKLAKSRENTAQKSYRTGRGGKCCGKSSPPWKSRIKRSESSDRFVPVFRTDRSWKDRDIQSTGRSSFWKRTGNDPCRYVRIYGKAQCL